MVFAVKDKAVQAASVTVFTHNRALFAQWQGYYKQFTKLQNERKAQIAQAIDGALNLDDDDDEESVDLKEIEKALANGRPKITC